MSSEFFSQRLQEIADSHQKIFEDYVTKNFTDSIAKICCFMDDEKIPQILETFSPEMKKIIQEKYAIYREDPEETFYEGLHILNTYDNEPVRPFKELIEELHTFPYSEAEDIIASTCKNNVILAEKIKNQHFNWKDFIFLDDRSIQKILREIDTNELVKALKGSESAINEKFLHNMSIRAANMIREDMEFFGPIRKEDAAAAQNSICLVAVRLIQSGEIIYEPVDESEFVV